MSAFETKCRGWKAGISACLLLLCVYMQIFFLFLADEPLIFLSGGQAERETAGGFFQVIT